MVLHGLDGRRAEFVNVRLQVLELGVRLEVEVADPLGNRINRNLCPLAAQRRLRKVLFALARALPTAWNSCTERLELRGRVELLVTHFA